MGTGEIILGNFIPMNDMLALREWWSQERTLARLSVQTAEPCADVLHDIGACKYVCIVRDVPQIVETIHTPVVRLRLWGRAAVEIWGIMTQTISLASSLCS